MQVVRWYSGGYKLMPNHGSQVLKSGLDKDVLNSVSSQSIARV